MSKIIGGIETFRNHPIGCIVQFLLRNIRFTDSINRFLMREKDNSLLFIFNDLYSQLKSSCSLLNINPLLQFYSLMNENVSIFDIIDGLPLYISNFEQSTVLKPGLVPSGNTVFVLPSLYLKGGSDFSIQKLYNAQDSRIFRPSDILFVRFDDEICDFQTLLISPSLRINSTDSMCLAGVLCKTKDTHCIYIKDPKGWLFFQDKEIHPVEDLPPKLSPELFIYVKRISDIEVIRPHDPSSENCTLEIYRFNSSIMVSNSIRTREFETRKALIEYMNKYLSRHPDICLYMYDNQKVVSSSVPPFKHTLKAYLANVEPEFLRIALVAQPVQFTLSWFTKPKFSLQIAFHEKQTSTDIVQYLGRSLEETLNYDNPKIFLLGRKRGHIQKIESFLPIPSIIENFGSSIYFLFTEEKLR